MPSSCQAKGSKLTMCGACRARHESGARKALGEGVLQQVEQTDLMSYGLIPEFVGRFPIITALHVSQFLTLIHSMSNVQATRLMCIVFVWSVGCSAAVSSWIVAPYSFYVIDGRLALKCKLMFEVVRCTCFTARFCAASHSPSCRMLQIGPGANNAWVCILPERCPQGHASFLLQCQCHQKCIIK